MRLKSTLNLTIFYKICLSYIQTNLQTTVNLLLFWISVFEDFRIVLVQSNHEFKCTTEGVNNQRSYLQVSKPWMLNTHKPINQKPWKSINICFCLPSQEMCIFEYTTNQIQLNLLGDLFFFVENTFFRFVKKLILGYYSNRPQLNWFLQFIKYSWQVI